MLQLPQAIPDPDLLLALEPEELATKLLFLVRQRQDGEFHPANLQNELGGDPSRGPPGYPPHRVKEIGDALTEAWAWLEAQGLVVPAHGTNGQNGWRRLSRRARRMESEADFASFKIARLLPHEILHPKIADPVWRAVMSQLVPLPPLPLPALIAAAGGRAELRFLEFFASNMRNPHTRRAYARAGSEFLAWRADKGIASITAVQPLHVATWVEAQTRVLSPPSVKQRFAALRHLFDWPVTGLDTFRRRIIQCAGRLIRPQGQLTLSMSANPTVQEELLHYLGHHCSPILRKGDRNSHGAHCRPPRSGLNCRGRVRTGATRGLELLQGLSRSEASPTVPGAQLGQGTL